MSDNIRKITQIIVNIIAIIGFVMQKNIDADYNTIYSIVSIVVLVVVICYDTYKNFDVTAEGKLGTKITRALKKGVIENDKVQEILDEVECDD